MKDWKLIKVILPISGTKQTPSDKDISIYLKFKFV